MANKKFMAVMLVLAVIFGIVFIGCDTEEKGDTYADGTEKIVLNNGSFECTDLGQPYVKGSYTTNGNSLTFTPSHWGGFIAKDDLGLDPKKWYSKSEILAKGGDPNDVNRVFASFYGTLSGNILTVTIFTGATGTYIKQ